MYNRKASIERNSGRVIDDRILETMSQLGYKYNIYVILCYQSSLKQQYKFASFEKNN